MLWAPPLRQTEQPLQTCAGITDPFLIFQKWLLQLVWLRGMLCDSILHLREECAAQWSGSEGIGKATTTGRAQQLDLIALSAQTSDHAWRRAAGFVRCPKLTCWSGQWVEMYLEDDAVVEMDSCWLRWTVRSSTLSGNLSMHKVSTGVSHQIPAFLPHHAYNFYRI